MKTIFFLILLFGLLSICLHAQHAAVLNINLYPVQTIEVNGSGKTVNLDYKTRDDYRNGVNITLEDQLKIFSTAGFAVKVKSESPTLTNINSENGIESSDITMTASRGAENGMDGFTSTAVLLSPVDTELLSSTTGGANKTFTMDYAAKGGDQYVNKRLNAATATVYTTQLTFSIEPR